MDTNFLKEVLVPISTIVTLLSVAGGTLLAVFAYRLNLKAETRLKESTKAEVDVKLLGLMINLIQKANGRSGYELSNEAVKKILESDKISKLDWFENGTNDTVNQILEDVAIMTFPVGSGEQDFAIKAIGELGIQHKFLRNISLTSLEELSKISRTKKLCDDLILQIKSI